VTPAPEASRWNEASTVLLDEGVVPSGTVSAVPATPSPVLAEAVAPKASSVVPDRFAPWTSARNTPIPWTEPVKVTERLSAVGAVPVLAAYT
jgi:hypothetical protein